MSRYTLRPTSREVLAALSLSLVMAAPLSAPAQSTGDRRGDYLDQVRNMNDVAAQKIESEVRSTLRATQRLMFSDPAKALERLKQTLAMLQDDSVLSEGRRATLIRVVKDRIRVAQAGPDTSMPDGAKKAQANGMPDGAKKAQAISRQAAQAQDSAADQSVQKSLENIRRLQQDGKTAEASRQAADLARHNPDNPAAQAASRQASALDRVAGERGTRREHQDRFASTMTDIDRSATPPAGDVDFPKDWKERSERRKKYRGVQLTTKEKAILQALGASVSVNFQGSTFETAIDYLSTLSNQPIIVDKAALKDADIGYDSPVNFKLKNVSMRTVLRKLLGEFGLAYVVKDQAILITTAQRAKEMMVVRAYPIGDLVSGIGGIGGLNPLQFGPVLGQALNQQQLTQNVNGIISMIQSSVEPDSWKVNGGGGTIAYDPLTMSLLVKQSAEVHALMGGGISR